MQRPKSFFPLPGVVFIAVLNLKGVVVGTAVVVVKHGKMFLIMVPFGPHTAVMQCPNPSVVL